MKEDHQANNRTDHQHDAEGGIAEITGGGNKRGCEIARGSAKSRDTAHFRICPSEHPAGDEEPCHIQHTSRHGSATDDTKQRTDIERDE